MPALLWGLPHATTVGAGAHTSSPSAKPCHICAPRYCCYPQSEVRRTSTLLDGRVGYPEGRCCVQSRWSGCLVAPGGPMQSCSASARLHTNILPAEVYATLCAIQQVLVLIDIASDNDTAVQGTNLILDGKGVPDSWDHQDPWRRIVAEYAAAKIRTRSPDPAHCRWTNSHADADDMRRGNSNTIDKVNSEHADHMAAEGVALICNVRTLKNGEGALCVMWQQAYSTSWQHTA